MNTQEVRRVTANLPIPLLEGAQKATGKGITETLIQGLKMIERQQAYAIAQTLKGKIQIEIDLSASRERHR